MRTETIDPKAVDLDQLIQRAVSFHGHLGPMVVTGIRMGLLALEILEHPGYFNLRAECRAGRVPPLSCLADGLQMGSGCTSGKGNLEIVDQQEASARFVTEDHRTVTLAVRPAMLARFSELDLDTASELARTCPIEELLTWTASPSA